MSVDLHTHSNVSDGTESPAAVIAAAAAAGLQGLALTDHDTTSGWDEAIAAALEHRIALLPGMEITTLTENGISVHLLSYLHDPLHPGLSAAVAKARDGRLHRARRIADRLSVDFPLTWETVEQHVSAGATVGRPHLADALVGIGAVADRQEAFDHLLHSASPYYVGQDNMHPATAIRLVREAGGVPVLAHGMASARGRTVSVEQLEEMVAAGLAGVEVYHRDNAESGREVLRELAARHDLLVTGSSDYHGTGKDNLIGENTTPWETVEALCAQATGIAPIRPE
ncbi:PHP domain-containing protein [Nesterenkonia sandarakina]|uniref:Polymerase/histidinol phosphatase N-terminal domain-containing protein n=1 Tax=Nesterenkonia sandarakina TaxID=272918 RepID=A0A2T0YIN7_9MICC|nr:PHP domain-containing protein [Nesterenkonia sandarakina]PRZ14985.1 hypothetical protein BCL67_11084 [Nesterenkonia sandarakina]